MESNRHEPRLRALPLCARGRDKAEAAEQLTLLYGHFPYLGSATSAMGRSFDAYAAATEIAGRNPLDLATR